MSENGFETGGYVAARAADDFEAIRKRLWEIRKGEDGKQLSSQLDNPPKPQSPADPQPEDKRIRSWVHEP
jgi:hypothetical protein